MGTTVKTNQDGGLEGRDVGGGDTNIQFRRRFA
jgi:hypothetical protein